MTNGHTHEITDRGRTFRVTQCKPSYGRDDNGQEWPLFIGKGQGDYSIQRLKPRDCGRRVAEAVWNALGQAEPGKATGADREEIIREARDHVKQAIERSEFTLDLDLLQEGIEAACESCGEPAELRIGEWRFSVDSHAGLLCITEPKHQAPSRKLTPERICLAIDEHFAQPCEPRRCDIPEAGFVWQTRPINSGAKWRAVTVAAIVTDGGTQKLWARLDCDDDLCIKEREWYGPIFKAPQDPPDPSPEPNVLTREECESKLRDLEREPGQRLDYLKRALQTCLKLYARNKVLP